jgi:hypothetical protein
MLTYLIYVLPHFALPLAAWYIVIPLEQLQNTNAVSTAIISVFFMVVNWRVILNKKPEAS